MPSVARHPIHPVLTYPISHLLITTILLCTYAGVDIADYVHNYEITSDLAFETARLCLIDTIGCGLEGLRFKECARLMGPVVEGTIVPNGAFSLFLVLVLRSLCSPVKKENVLTIDARCLDAECTVVNWNGRASRHKGPWHELPARSHSRRVQYWHDDPLARLQ